MRISNLLFCTLVAVIARELPQTANAATLEPVTDDDSNDISTTQEATEVIAAETTYVSIANPDIIANQQFSSHLDDASSPLEVSSSPSDEASSKWEVSSSLLDNPTFSGDALRFDNAQFSNPARVTANNDLIAENSTTLAIEYQGLEHQGLGHQGLGHQGLEHQGLEHQGLGHQGLEHQGLGHQGLEHQELAAQAFNNYRFAENAIATEREPNTNLIDTSESLAPTLDTVSEQAMTLDDVRELDPLEGEAVTATEKALNPLPSIDSGPSLGAAALLEGTTQWQLSQLPIEPPTLNSAETDQAIVDQLFDDLEQPSDATAYSSSPAITVSNPSGFGTDNFTGFVGFGYQARTRFANKDDGGAVIGMGFGDARENVGVQLSYTVASFGGSRDFGTGGFNAKLHKRVSDDWSVALGWEGFVTTGFVDFEDSIYASASHIIRTRDRITHPFSRVALTAGVGNGRFRTEEAIFDDRDDIGVFGSAAVRVAEPVSAIVEWTGQDLAAGVSITPFKNVPLVLLPAVRDITGAGDGARFVIGAGLSFQL